MYLLERVAPYRTWYEAANITVTNRIDGEPGSLRQALADANEATRSISMPLSLAFRWFSVNWCDKSVTISGPDANTFVVDADGRSRVFHITNGANVSISGLLIIGGQTEERGAGILNDHRR